MTFNLILDASKVAGDITTVASKVIKKVTYDVQATIVDRIRLGPKTGRIYKRRRKGKAGKRKGAKAFIFHQASAPGESPATDWGTLIGSISVTPFVNPLVGEIEISASYAAYLELGAPRAHLEPRPFIKPAIEDVIKRAQAGGY
jgi:hypothetical protein